MNEEEFSDILSQISDQNKSTRKRGLEKVSKLLEKEHVEFTEDQKDEMIRLFLRCLTDKYERCREVCCELCLAIFTKIPKEEVQKTLPFLFQVFARWVEGKSNEVNFETLYFRDVITFMVVRGPIKRVVVICRGI